MGNQQGQLLFLEETAGYETDLAVGERLKAVPLLSGYTPDQLGILGKLLTEAAFKDGELILKQGDPGEGFFIIAEGAVVVTRKNDFGETVHLGDLSGGDYFGEAALINNKPRGASVTAKGDTVTFSLMRHDFKKLFNSSQLNVHFAKRVAVSAGNKTLGHWKMPEGATIEKSDYQSKKIYEAVKSNILFEGLEKEVTMKVVAQMYKSTCAKGESIITQGDKGDLFYCCVKGGFDIFVTGRKLKVGRRMPFSCFGELALMYSAPRAATVTASMDSSVWCIHRSVYRRTVNEANSATLEEYSSFLRSVPLLSPLANYERARIAECLEEKTFKAGDTIFEQGAEGSEMYLVKEGEVLIFKDEEEVHRSVRGSCFGEIALLKDAPRAARAKADGDVTLLTIDKNTFETLLGPLENILKKMAQSYAGHGSADDEADEETEDIPFENLKKLGTLGKGSFGHVFLVKNTKGGDEDATYALKAVSKALVVETGQQEHLKSEKDVMLALKHPFIVRLYQTYRDAEMIYFLLEPALGGEVFTALRAQTLFDERTARFYASCVLLAFEHMHSKDIVYRDLKPENLLIDHMGYIKITDFGFAKNITSGRTWTLCGTPDYLAPEIVAGKGHGKGVDWWTLGILIFEMLASFPPFYDSNPMTTYHKIVNGDLNYPKQFSRGSISLIKKLLFRKASRRLGVVRGGATLMKKHVWFEEFNRDEGIGWTLLQKKELQAPSIPSIKNRQDLSNFEDAENEEDELLPYHDDGSNWDSTF